MSLLTQLRTMRSFKKFMGLTGLLVWTLSSVAEASCASQYRDQMAIYNDLFQNRSVMGNKISENHYKGELLFSSATAIDTGPKLGAALGMGATEGPIVGVGLVLTTLVGAPALSTYTWGRAKEKKVGPLVKILDEAAIGDGPALREFFHELQKPVMNSWDVLDVANILVKLDQDMTICAENHWVTRAELAKRVEAELADLK